MKNERDIDQITATIRERIPGVQVEQWIKLHPTDDDGLWYFRRHGCQVSGEIQLESSSGNCPFVRSNPMTGMTRSASIFAPTRDDAVS